MFPHSPTLPSLLHTIEVSSNFFLFFFLRSDKVYRLDDVYGCSVVRWRMMNDESLRALWIMFFFCRYIYFALNKDL